jgi:hypothetical protein
VTVFSSFFPMKLAAAHAYVLATRTSTVLCIDVGLHSLASDVHKSHRYPPKTMTPKVGFVLVSNALYHLGPTYRAWWER